MASASAGVGRVSEVRKPIDVENLYCKCQQITGALAMLTHAQPDASKDDFLNAIWGALHLAREAQGMAEVLTFGEPEVART